LISSLDDVEKSGSVVDTLRHQADNLLTGVSQILDEQPLTQEALKFAVMAAGCVAATALVGRLPVLRLVGDGVRTIGSRMNINAIRAEQTTIAATKEASESVQVVRIDQSAQVTSLEKYKSMTPSALSTWKSGSEISFRPENKLIILHRQILKNIGR